MELKFRAWDKVNEHMLLDIKVIDWESGYIVHEDLQDYSPSYERMEPPEPDCTSILDEVILMQYTGIKDKNGKDIYEGDIIERYDVFYCCKKRTWLDTGEVYWDEFAWETRGMRFPKGLGLAGDDERTIIGNIYENPELKKDIDLDE